MNRIQVLDCTLRDGGYVNDWRFGDNNARNIVELIAKTGVDYIELGFIRNCNYINDKLQFSDMSQITSIFRPSSLKLSAMVEIGYGYPFSKIPYRSSETVDMIRLVVWKRMQKECFEYAKALIDKGYEICIQATRIEQYKDDEFADFCAYFNNVMPKAIYMVDTFGLLNKSQLLKYTTVADQHLDKNISIGYHAHNNMQQAFTNMVALVEKGWNHSLMIDATVMGMGRGAGNLCLELLEKYLNENLDGTYNDRYINEIAEKYIYPIFIHTPWGYSIPYLLSARNGRNPSYVNYFEKKGVTICQMAQIFELMRERNVGIVYDEKMCDELLYEIQGTQTIS